MDDMKQVANTEHVLVSDITFTNTSTLVMLWRELASYNEPLACTGGSG